MSFFDDSHVTNVGLRGSAGPGVGHGELLSQSIRQQFRVDSARALDNEIRNRWFESLRAAGIDANSLPGERTVPFIDPLGATALRAATDPDPWGYRAFIQHISGQPIDETDPIRAVRYGDPAERIQGLIAANEKIKKLNNPNIKSFEQILEEVAQMQRGVEEETSSMYERSGRGGWLASLAGAVIGSFSTRDPLNILTAPIGAGRTVATRIATDMGIAATSVGFTELASVAPAREIAGLPERDLLFNIAAATIGAGVIRGGIEGIGAGVRRLRSTENIDFDLRDSQLQQMFTANSERPSARAASSILDDTIFIEKNNPYGEGRAASERFIAELRSVQRSMNGEPMTAVARVLPPVPFEYIKKAADLEIVREQAPDLYAKMEAAQAKVQELQARVTEADRGVKRFRLFHGSADERSDLKSAADLGVGKLPAVYLTEDRGIAQVYARQRAFEAGLKTEGHVDEVEVALENPLIIPLIKDKDVVELSNMAVGLTRENMERLQAQGYDGVINRFVDGGEVVVFNPSAISRLPKNSAPLKTLKQLHQSRRGANAEYEAAYRAVEAEAARLREVQARAEAAQQGEASNILAATSEGRPFVGPLLRHDSVSSLVDRINKFNETLDEQTLALFAREAGDEGKESVKNISTVPLYHGTTAKFKEFDLSKKGTGASAGIKTTIADGVYLTGDKDLAANFVKGKSGANVRTVYADLRNPYILKEGELITNELGEQVKKLGHDGIVREFDDKPLEVVVFDPKKITDAPVKQEAWRTNEGIDIGLREPVDPDFRVPTDDGDISVADAMRDLQDDTDLVEAVRSCAI